MCVNEKKFHMFVVLCCESNLCAYVQIFLVFCHACFVAGQTSSWKKGDTILSPNVRFQFEAEKLWRNYLVTQDPEHKKRSRLSGHIPNNHEILKQSGHSLLEPIWPVKVKTFFSLPLQKNFF